MESKLDEFKKFIKTKPFLAKDVRDGKITWQVLYETYDLFGEDHEFFMETKESGIPKEENVKTETEETNQENTETSQEQPSKTTEQLNKFMKQIQKIDTKKLSDGLDNVKKIVGIIDEFRPTGGANKIPSMRIKPFRRYND